MLNMNTVNTEFAVLAAGSDSGITKTVLIDCLTNFIAKFEPFKATDTLPVAVRSFFENGGGSCHLNPTTELSTEMHGRNSSLLVAAGQNILEAVSKLCLHDACLFAVLDGPQEKLA
jgi:hypothetical protein